MVQLKVLELCRMKLMVHNYTTGPNDGTIYNSPNRRNRRIGRNWRLAYWPIYIIIIYIIYINSIMVLGLIETFYIVVIYNILL